MGREIAHRCTTAWSSSQAVTDGEDEQRQVTGDGGKGVRRRRRRPRAPHISDQYLLVERPNDFGDGLCGFDFFSAYEASEDPI